MSMLEELKELGVNTEEAVARLAGNENLYKKMLVKFTALVKGSSVRPDMFCNDCMNILEEAHAIKGVTGNLSLTPLYEAYSRIVSLLRENNPEQAKEELNKILPVQEAIIECIERNA